MRAPGLQEDPYYNYHGVHVSPRSNLESKSPERPPAESKVSEDAANDDGVSPDDEYDQAFGRRSKIMRTPLTSGIAFEGEFGDLGAYPHPTSNLQQPVGY